jgi:hypothetical protein
MFNSSHRRMIINVILFFRGYYGSECETKSAVWIQLKIPESACGKREQKYKRIEAYTVVRICVVLIYRFQSTAFTTNREYVLYEHIGYIQKFIFAQWRF